MAHPAQLSGQPWPLDNHMVYMSLQLILFAVLPGLHVHLPPCPPLAHTRLSQSGSPGHHPSSQNLLPGS